MDRLRSTACAIYASFAASGEVCFTPKDALVGHGLLSESAEISVSAQRRKDFKVLSSLNDLSGNQTKPTICLAQGTLTLCRNLPAVNKRLPCLVMPNQLSLGFS